MTKLTRWANSAVFALCVGTAIATPAQILTTLVEFEDTNGATPYYVLLAQGRDGTFYGTTEDGGGPGVSGTLFNIAPNGTLKYVPAHGYFPYAGLVLGGDGNFYGTSQNGGAYCRPYSGCGTVFKVSARGQQTTLHSFGGTDGQFPQAALIQAIDGNFYGTTYEGGDLTACEPPNGCGTIFRITPAGQFTTLHNFEGTDGWLVVAPLVQGVDGALYGAAEQGGAHGRGTIFKISSPGSFTTVYDFCRQQNCTDGGAPLGQLVQASDGNLYGTTARGGAADAGTVFKITPKGRLTTLYSFCSQPSCSDGSYPHAGLVQGTDGRFYGTTGGGGISQFDYGTIFTITAEGMLTTLHAFNHDDGSLPYGGLVQSTTGDFYGTTLQGGDLSCDNGSGCGTVFRLDIGLGPFVTFVRAAGKVGQTGGILGQGFTGTTSVTLNGVRAAFEIVSDTYIKATVPPGATSGYVAVSTPTGTLTSNKPFIVLP